MKKLFLVYSSSLIVLSFLVSGCVIRTIPFTRERVDQKIEGNKGYLAGTPPEKEVEQKSPRQMYNIEIELPPHGNFEWKDSELTGNRGYIMGGYKIQEKTIPKVEEQRQTETKAPSTIMRPIIYPAPTAGLRITSPKPALPKQKAPAKEEEVKLIERYVVQKGDTLQKIAAKEEVYGNWRKWKKLYEANKEKIKDPDKIVPGLELVIPRD